jgi:hypothetical protein
MPATEKQETGGPYVHLDLSFHLSSEIKYAFTHKDDDSLGSSVQSGLRNSLHSSYDFQDLDLLGLEDYSDVDSFGSRDEEFPNWRLDPEESESDWTIVIESVPDGAISEYHVHKCVLAEGLKKSDFFVSFFNLSSEQKMDDEGRSVSKVHADAAKLIPDMLDYLYSIHDILKISTETAVAIRHLSQFFGIRALSTVVVSFVYEDMQIDNMKTYLMSATAFDDLQTQKLCAQRCAEHIKEINPYSDLLTEMDPSFLLDILASPNTDRQHCSSHLSKLVSVFCDLHRDIIDGGVFEELTSVEYLPVISKEAAVSLLTLEAELLDDARNESRGLTYLQKRCADALAPLIQPEDVREKAQRSRAKTLKKIPKKVLVELLSRSLCIP